jgi:hypothetical protein
MLFFYFKENNVKNKIIFLRYLISLFLLIITLISCTSTPKSTSMSVANAVEVMGINWSKYQGRILRIVSQGNEFTNAETVRENALIRATWEVHKLGFEYFIILSENGTATHSSFTTSGSARTRYDGFGNAYTTYTPGQTYNSTSHSLIIMVFGCNEEELINDVPTVSVSSRIEKAQQYFDINKEKLNE